MNSSLPWDLKGERFVLSPLWRHPSNDSIRKGLRQRGARVFSQHEMLRKLTESLHAFEGRRFNSIILASAEIAKDPLWLSQLLNCPIKPELDLASELIPVPLVAVTGTNGKTSTTEMLALALNMNKRKAQAFINFERSVLSLKKPLPQFAVVECCSAQLEHCKSFAPKISVLLNLAPNHLDHHPSFAEYEEAKSKIFRYQSREDFLVFNGDCPRTMRLVRRYLHTPVRKIGYFLDTKPQPGLDATLSVNAGAITWRDMGGEARLIAYPSWPEWGRHFDHNRLACLTVAKLLGLELKRTAQALARFKPRAHRQELLKVKGRLTFINDAKSTSVHSAAAALRRFADSKNRPLIWLTGGTDKNLPLDDLPHLLAKNVDGVVILGAFPRLETLLKKHGIQCFAEKNLAEALKKAHAMMGKQGVLLFSPIGASDDLFRDYEDRGKKFVAAVGRLLR